MTSFLAFIMSLFFVVSPPGTPVDEEEYEGSMSYESALMILENDEGFDYYIDEDGDEVFILEEPSCLENDCDFLVENLLDLE